MKFRIYLLVIVFAFFIGLLPTKAEIVKYIYGSAADNLAINETEKAYKYIGSIPLGAKLKIYDTNKYGSLCGGMYKVSYLDITGYVCSTTTKLFNIETIIPDDIFKSNVLSKFPATYHPYLVYLHEQYPNAIFEVMDTGIEWTHKYDASGNIIARGIVDEQIYLGKNLIQIQNTDNTKNGWKNQETLNIDTGLYRNDFDGGGDNWYSPSKEVVSYYLDPRNFLNDIYIFQFEQLSFNENFHNITGVQSILNGTFMESKKIQDLNENDISYAQAFMQAGSDFGVSPYYLAAKVIQEVGSSGNNEMVTGEYPGYEGYYNYFNICANGSSPIINGLICAQGGINKNETDTGRPWNTPYRAIRGGAEFIYKGYLKGGQDTSYTQKFDIIGDLYTKQYMQNIQASASETSISFSKGISTITNYKNLPFVFKIPVYNNMPNETALPNAKVILSGDNGSKSEVSNPKSPSIQEPKIIYGDASRDGIVDVLDILYIQKYLLGIIAQKDLDTVAADVSRDEKVDILDILVIKRHLLGIEYIK